MTFLQFLFLYGTLYLSPNKVLYHLWQSQRVRGLRWGQAVHSLLLFLPPARLFFCSSWWCCCPLCWKQWVRKFENSEISSLCLDRGREIICTYLLFVLLSYCKRMASNQGRTDGTFPTWFLITTQTHKHRTEPGFTGLSKCGTG